MKFTPHIVRKNIKNLYLRIDKNGNLLVSAPLRMTDSQIYAFIEKKQNWIANKQKQCLQKKEQYEKQQRQNLYCPKKQELY